MKWKSNLGFFILQENMLFSQNMQLKQAHENQYNRVEPLENIITVVK